MRIFTLATLAAMLIGATALPALAGEGCCGGCKKKEPTTQKGETTEKPAAPAPSEKK